MTDFWDKPDLLVVGGSNLYGYATPESDEDLLGFVIPPIETVLGFTEFEQKVPTKAEQAAGNDKKIYSVKKFFRNLLRNDTQSLEILFAPGELIRECTKAGEAVIACRDLFISRTLYKRFIGYAYSEYRKVRGVRFVPEKRKPTESSAIDQVREVFRPDKKTMDEVIDLLYADRPKVEQSCIGNMGTRRKEDIEKYGYSVKNAAHCIRLLMEGIEILRTGTLTFPRPENELVVLRKMRAGEYSLESVDLIYQDLEAGIKKACDDSDLPAKPDHKKAEKLLISLITENLGISC